MDNVKPTVEEVQDFYNAINKTGDYDSDDDLEKKAKMLLMSAICNGNTVDINKGDKIRVIKSDLNGVTGTVVSIEDGQLLFKPNIPDFNDNLKLDSKFVSKYFEPGDKVRVIEGKYKGETGLVTSNENKFCDVVLNGKEIKILSNFLKLK